MFGFWLISLATTERTLKPLSTATFERKGWKMAFINCKLPCIFLASLWVATVISLTRFCVIELRIMRFEKGLTNDVGSITSSLAAISDNETSSGSPLVDLLRRIQQEKHAVELNHPVQQGEASPESADDANCFSPVAELHNNTVSFGSETPQAKSNLVIHVGPR